MDLTSTAAGEGGLGDDPPEQALASAWTRFWARTLDLQVEGFAIGFVVAFVFPGVVAALAPLGRSWPVAYGVILLPLMMLADACIQAAFGQTLGKAVFGIRVETAGGARLSLGAAIRRNALVYLKGLALGIPIFSLWGCWLAYDRVKRGEATSWDRDLGARVVARGASRVRTVGAAVATVILAGVLQGPSRERARPADVSGAIADHMEAMLPRLNAALPKQVDGVTRLDGVGYSRAAVALTYTYSLVLPDGRPAGPDTAAALLADKTMQGVLRGRYCKEASFERFRTNEIAVHFRYLDAAGGLVKDYGFTPEDCRIN